MLVLKRRPGQSIWINDNIEIKILEPDDDSNYRIGVEAPPEILILRGELKETCAEMRREYPDEEGNK